jgi:hypothetical protein
VRQHLWWPSGIRYVVWIIQFDVFTCPVRMPRRDLDVVASRGQSSSRVGGPHQGTETKLSTFLHFFYLPQVMQVKSENKKNYLWLQVAGKALVVSINE